INNELYAQLLDLGFDDFTARLALIRTANTGVEEAVNWIIERSNPSDFEDNSSSSDGGEDVEMGAVNSTGGDNNQSSSVLSAFPQQTADSFYNSTLSQGVKAAVEGKIEVVMLSIHDSPVAAMKLNQHLG
ncbi:UBA/TS-N domain protein, partial [Cooperia oncophora]